MALIERTAVPQIDHIITRRGVAELLGVSLGTLRKLPIRSVRLSPRRVGYRASAVTAFLDQQSEAQSA